MSVLSRALQGALRACRRTPAPIPEGRAITRLLDRLAAEDFLDADAGDRAPDRFVVLASALSSGLERERRALQAIEELQARPMQQGRTPGLEWAYVELFESVDRCRQARDLLQMLAPIEPQVRALLAARAAS